MKKWVLLMVVVGMLGWAVYDFIGSYNNSAKMDQVEAESNSDEAEGHVIGLSIGNKAPDFQLETLTGDTVKLSDFYGKRVMINFWATWCPPCRAEMPDMEKFHQDKDIVILAVNLTDSETKTEDVGNFIKEFGLTFPVLMDVNSDVATLYAIKPIPTTFMVDSNGIISYKAFGAMNYDLMVQEFEKME